MVISEKHIKVLECLALYRYLTVKQFVTLGIYHTEKGMRDKVLIALKRSSNPLIKVADFGFIAGKGRLSGIHYLTKRGALALADYHGGSLENIPFPVGQVQFSRDYFHRVEFISIHIALRLWAEKTGNQVEFFHSYFDSSGNQRQENSQLIRDTQIQLNGKSIVPDGNFCLKMKDNQSRLFTLELHKGTNTKRIIEQLENHARMVEQELIPNKYQHPYDNYILSVYDTPGTMAAVKNRFSENALLSEFSDYYAFCSTEVLFKDFSKPWRYANNTGFSVFL